ncbi:hypothetical protein COCON_G00203580, partial [Conger conger]
LCLAFVCSLIARGSFPVPVPCLPTPVLVPCLLLLWFPACPVLFRLPSRSCSGSLPAPVLVPCLLTYSCVPASHPVLSSASSPPPRSFPALACPIGLISGFDPCLSDHEVLFLFVGCEPVRADE